MVERPLRVAVVGSGPSGIYAADALTAQSSVPVSVDVIDRLPAPFGLVRYGVAPDHLSIRSVRGTLDKTLGREAVRYLGNVRVGEDLTLDDLHRHYDAVVFCYGAASDRRLGIPGEDLRGQRRGDRLRRLVLRAPGGTPAGDGGRARRGDAAVVVGVGNVAVDVTRVLAKTVGELERTDMPQHVLDALAASRITDVHLLGRRGPAQGAFTTKELRELGELAEADVIVDPADLVLDPGSEAAVAASRVLARNYDVLTEWAGRPLTGKPRRIHVRFLTRPVELLGTDRVTGVVVERTRLDERARRRAPASPPRSRPSWWCDRSATAACRSRGCRSTSGAA